MVADYPQEIVTQPISGTAADVCSGSFFSRLSKRVQSVLCSLHGHDPLLHFDRKRIYLRCASCGYETPGWELDQRRPRIRFRGDAQRQFMARAQLPETRGRKIA